MFKKAVVTHPVTMFFIAVVIGMVLGLLWAAGILNNYFTIPEFPFCP